LIALYGAEHHTRNASDISLQHLGLSEFHGCENHKDLPIPKSKQKEKQQEQEQLRERMSRKRTLEDPDSGGVVVKKLEF